MWDVARSAARDLGVGLLDLLFPRVCAGCSVAIDEPALCGRCMRTMRSLPERGCSRCQDELPPARSHCSRCETSRSAIASTTASVYYEGEAERWVREFKYPRQGLRALAPGPEAVAHELLSRSAALSRAQAPDLIIPIPLHPRRLRARGFNPAAILAQHLARQLDVAFDSLSLERVRDTPTQTRLSRRARRANVRGAFACKTIDAETVWLVDDVVTTGSTLEEAAQTVRKAGAACIHAVCAARTPASDRMSR